MAQRSHLRAIWSVWDRENSTNNPQISSSVIPKEEDGVPVTVESLLSEEVEKRELPLEEAKPKRQRMQKRIGIAKSKRKKYDNSVERWSKER